jgi:hypothetical protein
MRARRPVGVPALLPSQSTTSYPAPGKAAIMLRSNHRSSALALPADRSGRSMPFALDDIFRSSVP